MKTSVAPEFPTSLVRRSGLIIAMLIAIVAMTVPFYSTFSSSSDRNSVSTPNLRRSSRAQGTRNNSLARFAGLPMDETIATFAADCTTARTSFVLGETVCAVVNGVTETDRFVNWIDPNLQDAFSSPTIPDSGTHSYTYTPTVAGTWKASIADPSDTSIIPAVFNVVAPGPIQTYTSGCAITQDTFNLGSTVCAKLIGGVPSSKIAWIDPAGYIRQSTPVTTDPQNDTFSVPATATSTLDNGDEVSNVGTWRVAVISSRGALSNYLTFYVRDPANDTVDVGVAKTVPAEGAGISPGSTTAYTLTVSNEGPDAAQNVVLTDVLPANTTFVSLTPAAGCTTPSAGGTGTVTCNIATLARGASATFDLSVQVDSGVSPGVSIVNTASVASATTDSFTDNNSFTSIVKVVDSGTVACTLTCPADMTVTADTTQAGEPGAFVTFSAASVSGSCGAISNFPASGSFFTLGSHIVTSTAESGDMCTFTVTVVNTPPPTISCPANQTVTAASGQTSANVSVGTPTTNPSTGVTVVGVRDDDPNCTEGEDPGCTSLPLTDPYPIGATTITWTVTQANGQKASCTQTITVLENSCGGDTQNPTITAPADITVGTGPDPSVSKFCTVALDDELGQAEASDDCTFTVTVTGIPANNAFPIGTTILTYTARDGAGNEASDTQQVTVFDNTPPIIVAPPDASFTCISDVPTGAAAIALARGDDPNLPNGGPPTDNCGAPVITFSDSSTGAGTVASPRIITRTYTATDTSPLQNSASAVQVITVIDPTPPTISCPSDIVVYLPLNSTATSMPVNFTVNGSDNCAGVSVVTTPASGSTFSVGTTTVNSTATDWAGNSVSCSFTVTVLYNFTGFFQPVDNLPTLNVVNAGRGVPVKFSLSGDKGLNIFAANSPYTIGISCDGSVPQVDVEETLTAGSSSLSYSPDTYNYTWKTENSWAGTCRQLVVKLNDGSEHRANFKFR